MDRARQLVVDRARPVHLVYVHTTWCIGPNAIVIYAMAAVPHHCIYCARGPVWRSRSGRHRRRRECAHPSCAGKLPISSGGEDVERPDATANLIRGFLYECAAG